MNQNQNQGTSVWAPFVIGVKGPPLVLPNQIERPVPPYRFEFVPGFADFIDPNPPITPPVPPVSGAFTSGRFDYTGATPTFTYADTPIGDAAGGRRIAVFVEISFSGTTTPATAAGVSVGGVPLLYVNGSVSGASNLASATLWVGTVPTGTTADVVVTVSRAQLSQGIQVYALYDTPVMPTDSHALNTNNPLTANVVIPENGLAAGGARSSGASSTTASWSGLSEDYDAQQLSTFCLTSASVVSGAGGTTPVSCTFSAGTARYGVFAAWGPGEHAAPVPEFLAGTIGGAFTTHTFPGQSLGDEDPDRWILVGFEAVFTGTTAATIVSVTVGGVYASILVQANGTDGSALSLAGAAIVRVPTGTTADIVVVTSRSAGMSCLLTYRVVGGNPNAHATYTSAVTDPTANVVIPAGGWGVGFGVSSGGSNATATWTGMAEDFDQINSGSRTFTCGHTVDTGTIPTLIDFSAGIRNVGVFLSWGAG